MNNENSLRKELLNYLDGQHTHLTLRDAASNLPEELMNVKPDNVPYTFWGLLEHIRITQYDMIDFIRNSNYKELRWPEEYWPNPDEHASKQMWENSIKQYENNLQEFISILKNEDTNLFEPIPHGTGQTILKEVLQIIDHSSYHIGQFILMRRLFNNLK